MSTPKFIVSHEDQQLGPFDEAELKARWATGKILGVDYVYDERKEDWIMIAERFRWAAAGALTDTVRVAQPPKAITDTIRVTVPLPAMTEEIPVVAVAALEEAEVALPPPAPVAAPIATIEVPVLNIPVIAPPAAPAVMIEMNDGYGEISLDALDAGTHELRMRNADLQTGTFKLDVLPTEPEAITWTVPAALEVGQNAVIEVRVTDGRGLACRHFSEVVTLEIDEKRHPVQTIDGVGRFEFTREQALASRLTVTCASRPTLKAPPAHLLEWHPGPAVRLVVDGPTEHQEGIPLKVRVKALDRFGNVARSYRGAVSLEIKAS